MAYGIRRENGALACVLEDFDIAKVNELESSPEFLKDFKLWVERPDKMNIDTLNKKHDLRGNMGVLNHFCQQECYDRLGITPESVKKGFEIAEKMRDDYEKEHG